MTQKNAGMTQKKRGSDKEKTMAEETKKEEKKEQEQKNVDEGQNVLLKKLHEKIDALALAMERSNIKEYIDLTKKPWKIMLNNFIGGISRGFGLAIGMTLIAAIVIVILTKVLAQLITLPFVGQQIAQLVELVNQYMKESSQINIKGIQ
jgi:hypothetical protein